MVGSINIRSFGQSGFNVACENGNMNIIKHLLDNIPDISVESGFNNACKKRHIEVIKYLALRFKEKFDMDESFLYFCELNYLELVHFLIFEVDLKKTNAIKELYKKNPNKQVEDWFKMRTLNKKLKRQLKNKLDIKVSSKVKKTVKI